MAHIYFTESGTAYKLPDGTTTPVSITIPNPADAAPVTPARRPVLLHYRKHFYNVGQFDRLIVADEAEEFRIGGMEAPTTTPVLADGAFASGSEGEMIAYQTFARYLTIDSVLTKICESNPGPQSNTLSAAGTGRSTSNLDTSAPAHATHTLLYISVDGALPALASITSLTGFTGTISENTLTGALGFTLPVKIGIDGSTELDLYARGIPPYTMYAEIYNDAMFYAGDPDHPERIYVSKLFEPEAVNTTPITVYGRTEYPWLTTTDSQPVTGIKKCGDELIVGKPRGVDIISGISGAYAIKLGSSHFGVISHFSMKVCGPISSLWFASQQGVVSYLSGTFRPMSASLDSWWKDAYRDNAAVFEGCYAATNLYWGTYKLLFTSLDIGYGTGSVYLSGDYRAAEVGEPVWVFDFRNRLEYCQLEAKDATATQRASLYSGGADGYVRREDVMTDATDDGDTFYKKFLVHTPHIFPQGQDGDDAHALTFTGLDLHLVHENQQALLSIVAGDDKVTDAIDASQQQWTWTSPASAKPTGKRQAVARTSEHHTLLGVSGKGATLTAEVVLPKDIEFRGWSLEYIPSGAQDRPFTE